MGFRDVAIGIALAAILFQGWQAYQEMNRKAFVSRVTKRDTLGKAKLTEHSKVFNKKEVIQVTPKLHIAVGYALANAMLIEGKDGIVIVDVTESMSAAREVMAAFRKITKKPVKGIIYTHNHPDHVNGAKAFIEDEKNPPVIWAHHDLVTLIQRQNYIGAIFFQRAMRQFGMLIPDLINAGIGPQLRVAKETDDLGLVYPSKLMTGVERDISIAGIDMKLVHIPGETEDQIGVWLPGDRAFLCADDVYEAFPNLYAIRGTPNRDLLHWSSSIDRMLSYKPKYLVPSHTRPVEGDDTIKELLTGYRDAIQYVHDQTIRYMNKGYLPDEIAEIISLPEHLANHPYLQEFYGTVKWSVKGTFNGYMGWFSGDPIDLSPLTPNDMAQRMVHLVGGIDKLVQSAEGALGQEEWQWGLVLSSYVLRVDKGNLRAREVKVKCLMALGESQISANGRNYYLTSAMEELGEISTKAPKSRVADFVRGVPIYNLFKMLEVRWNAEVCGVVNSTIHFTFTDIKQDITVTTRNSVVIISDKPPAAPAKVKVTTTSEAWRDSLTSSFSGLTSLATGALKVEGGLSEFNNVMGCFDKDT